jgi:hypothetical protein
VIPGETKNSEESFMCDLREFLYCSVKEQKNRQRLAGTELKRKS